MRCRCCCSECGHGTDPWEEVERGAHSSVCTWFVTGSRSCQDTAGRAPECRTLTWRWCRQTHCESASKTWCKRRCVGARGGQQLRCVSLGFGWKTVGAPRRLGHQSREERECRPLVTRRGICRMQTGSKEDEAVRANSVGDVM